MVFFSNAKFVSYYSPPIPYTRLNTPLDYSFTISEETQLGEYSVENSYKLDVSLLFDYKNYTQFYFKIQTLNPEFKLDQDLIAQGKLLEDLSQLTQTVQLTVNQNGSIEGFDYKKLLKKWEELKPQLLKRHKGKQVESYIEEISKRVHNEALLLERLKDPRLYGLLFDGLQTLHEKSKARRRKVSWLLHTLPVLFEEKVTGITEKDNTRHFTLEGQIVPLTQEVKDRINNYLNYFEVGGALPFLAHYKKEALLDLSSGYLKASTLEIVLTNASGFTRKKHIHLKLQDHG